MNIDIEPVKDNGKHKYQLRVDGKQDKVLGHVPIGKTGLRIRINELITEIG